MQKEQRWKRSELVVDVERNRLSVIFFIGAFIAVIDEDELVFLKGGVSLSVMYGRLNKQIPLTEGTYRMKHL